ncbi:MAG: hypothetical protein ACFUZC_09875 [Chthoniobacteraceae bacterium]
MATILPKEKQIMVVGALAEGNSIRSIERMSGIHRDTIMRLGVRVGQGCKTVLDERMRGLNCSRIEVDEIGGFIEKKNAQASTSELVKGVSYQRPFRARRSSRNLKPRVTLRSTLGYRNPRVAPLAGAVLPLIRFTQTKSIKSHAKTQRRKEGRCVSSLRLCVFA